MAQTIEEALSQAELYSDDLLYRFIQLPINAVTAAASIIAETRDPFMALLVDKDEVSLMLPQEDYESFQKRLRDAKVSEIRYRLITFDVALEPTLVGFMARISRELAEAGVSILPFAAYTRDHIFVSEADYGRAIQTLQGIK